MVEITDTGARAIPIQTTGVPTIGRVVNKFDQRTTTINVDEQKSVKTQAVEYEEYYFTIIGSGSNMEKTQIML